MIFYSLQRAFENLFQHLFWLEIGGMVDEFGGWVWWVGLVVGLVVGLGLISGLDSD